VVNCGVANPGEAADSGRQRKRRGTRDETGRWLKRTQPCWRRCTITGVGQVSVAARLASRIELEICEQLSAWSLPITVQHTS
jgi:hypothetical protein